jgi:CRP-like cAMP-binding protein
MSEQTITKQALPNSLKVETYSQDEIIFESGTSSESKLYFILEGDISIRRDGFSASFINTITKGNFFGEISLINNNPRNETISAKTSIVKVVSMSAEEYTNSIKINKVMLKKLLLCVYARFQFAINFYLDRKKDISPPNTFLEDTKVIREKNLSMIGKIFTPASVLFDDKETIYREIDFTKGSFYLIETGQVQIKKKPSEKSDYLNISVLHPGELFGENAYFGAEHRKERALAIGRVKFREINKNAFETLMNIHTDYYLNFIYSILWKTYSLESKIKLL